MAHPENHSAAVFAARLEDGPVGVVVDQLCVFRELCRILRLTECLGYNLVE